MAFAYLRELTQSLLLAQPVNQDYHWSLSPPYWHGLLYNATVFQLILFAYSYFVPREDSVLSFVNVLT